MLGLAAGLATGVRADFAPIALAPSSFNEQMIVAKGAPAVPNGGATTASMDDSFGNIGNSWYEQGYNTNAPATGLPQPGTTITSLAFPTHKYTMPSSYAVNDTAMIDQNDSTTLTLATPAAYTGLSFLAAAGNGPVTVDFTIHHMDGSTESGTFGVIDWFGSNTVAFVANGRVDVQAGTFDSVNGGNPKLFSIDASLINVTSPVTSIDLSATSSSGLAAIFALSGQTAPQVTLGSAIKWGLTITNINNPSTVEVITNSDGSIAITTAGGDTYGNPDSFTYAFQQVTGDFDVRVRVLNCVATDTSQGSYDSPKGSLMVRSSLSPDAYDFMINALPLYPSDRSGEIETIGRIVLGDDTNDLPGRGYQYGQSVTGQSYQGDTTDTSGFCTYPDVWLRIQRQGEKLMSYFATDNTEDLSGNQWNPGSTNGWQLLGVVHADPADFPPTLLVGLSTVAHNNNDTSTGTDTVTSTYADYGPTPNPPSTPSVGYSSGGSAAIPGTTPGPFPITMVLAANIDASVSADGMGYPSDVVQSNQGPAQPIIWNDGGYSGVTRDIIADIPNESPDSFCFARYQTGAFDFMLSPGDPAAAFQNLGPYSNPMRERFTAGTTNVPASQAWAPSPNYGFCFTTVRKNGEAWNDGSPSFYAATYVQLDGVATGAGYDMVGGHFRGAQFYTRTTKLVTGTPLNPASSGPSSGSLQRCALPIALAWFPYAQGWQSAFIDSSLFDSSLLGTAFWKHGDGYGLQGGTALHGFTAPAAGLNNVDYYNFPTNLTWLADTNGNYSGLGTLTIPGVNSLTDGILLTTGNDENNGIRGPHANNAALPDGSGWYVAVRDIETSKPDPTIYAMTSGDDAGSSFSYIYIPYNSDNLVAGHISTNGTKIGGAGSFSVSRLSTGVYALTIPGKTGTNGVLLLQNTGYLAEQPTGFTNVVDTSYLCYEYGGTNTPNNAFIITSHDVNDSGGGEGVVGVRDAEFYFVYVDFTTPLAPAGTTPPVLSATRPDSQHIVISWSNGAGFTLQQTSSLAGTPTWTDIGTANPSAPIAIGSGPAFFRVSNNP